MTQHPYAEILRAIAGGKEIEWKSEVADWVTSDPDHTMQEIVNRSFPPERYRVKPETISINGIEVPKPLAKLQAGDLFWPSFADYADGNWVEEELRYRPQLLEACF